MSNDDPPAAASSGSAGSPSGSAGPPSAATSMAKTELRQRRIAARAAMTPFERESARAAIRETVLARAAAGGWRCVAAYVPLRTEPGSVALLEDLVEAGVRVLVPVTLVDLDLDWAPWQVSGPGRALGRSAVAEAAAVLVPAFAVGDDGMRLGRGGGSYDRALPRCAASAETAALLFDGERERRVPAEHWDRPVRAVVTPSGWAPLG